MKFTKMHGIGNDYVYVNCFKEKVEDPGEAAIKVSDRHFGIGSDGLILIKQEFYGMFALYTLLSITLGVLAAFAGGAFGRCI